MGTLKKGLLYGNPFFNYDSCKQERFLVNLNLCSCSLAFVSQGIKIAAVRCV